MLHAYTIAPFRFRDNAVLSQPQQRIAVTAPVSPGVEATLRHVRWAEDEGFDDIWFSDSGGVDALSLAAAIGVVTERVRVGTAVVPVYTRTPAVLAASAYTLHEACGGRFILGLGSSSQTMMEQWHGVEFRSPLARMRETVALVRAILAGERSDFDGEAVRSHGYRQPALGAGAVPIHLAGLRGRMLELAGEVGDGVVVNLFPKRALPKIMEHIRLGAGRVNAPEREVVCRHQVLVTDDRDGARALFRQHFAPYYATPVYNRFLAWAGFDEVAATIEAGWAARDRAATTGALSDALVDEIAIIGSADECRERVRELAAGGISTHIIACLSREPDDMRRTFDAFRPAVFGF